MSPESVKRAAIYTRVSTEDQAEGGFSLPMQLDRLKAYIFSHGWAVAGIYVEEGVSGRTTRRPQYQQMFNDIASWDAIVTMKMDRIHRSSKNFMEMMEFLAKNNKEFVSMTESLDTTTAMGRFVMNIISNIAQLESEQIGERVFGAMRQKAKTTPGVFNGHFRPWGYKIVDHQLVPEPEKLKLVKQCFEYYDQGLSTTEISKKTGLKWCTLRYILHNSVYAGMEQWCYIFKRARIQPLISLELFNRVQVRLVECNSRAKKEGLVPLQLTDVDSFEIPLADRKYISGLRTRMPKHKIS